jgi:hypothetical protein
VTVFRPPGFAVKYQEFVPAEWWNGVAVYARPAEETIPNLRADTVVCWNCIDHTIGWRAILDNMLTYGNPGARFAIATDFFDPFLGHPGFERNDFMREIEARFTVIEAREPFEACCRSIRVRRSCVRSPSFL